MYATTGLFMELRISVIIPALNEAEHIGPLVHFLLKNGGGAVVEILVVDAGSTDETVQMAALAGAQVVHASVKSRAAQMNKGARIAKGNILYFVHADTLPPVSFSRDIPDAINAGSAMGCFAYRFDVENIWLKINAYFNRYNFLWCQGGDKTFFIKKETFEALHGYDERFVIMEEYDFLRRARRQYKLITVRKFAVVSSRKYRRNSWIKVQIANIITFNMFRLGVAPERMKRFYKSVIR